MRYTVDDNGNLVGEDGSVIPADQVKQDDFSVVGNELDQYQTPGQQALGVVEEALQGLTLGGSDLIEQKVLAPANPALFGPEARKKRREANPIKSFIGNMVGTGTLATLTGGGAKVAQLAGVNLAEKGLAGKALEYGIEGAFLGGGEAVSELALGEPDLNASKIASMVTTGGVFGAGLGGLSYALKAALPFLKESKNVPRGTKALQALEKTENKIEEPVYFVESKGKPFTTLQQIDETLEAAKKNPKLAELFEMPQKAAADDAVAHLNPKMHFPYQDIQVEAYSDPQAMKDFLLRLDRPGEPGRILRSFLNVQNNELRELIKTSIQDIAPGHTLATDFKTAGERAARLMDEVVQTTRKDLIPELRKIKTADQTKNNLYGVLQYLTDGSASPFANPEIGNMFHIVDGQLAIKPFKDVKVLTKPTYEAIKKAENLLRKEPTNIKALFEIREGLIGEIDKTANTKVSQQLTQAQAAMLDYIQKEVVETIPDAKVRDIMTKYAKNEDRIDYLQSVIGADIDLKDWRRVSQSKAPEHVLDKIFKDSHSAKAVKEIVGEDNFATITADYLNNVRLRHTKDNVLSHQNMSNFLSREAVALSEAFKTRGSESFEDIKAALTALRLFPVTATGNPSGTAKTLMASLSPKNIKEKLFGKVEDTVQQQIDEYAINKKLNQAGEKATQMSILGKMIKDADKSILHNAREAFLKTSKIGAQVMLSKSEFEEKRKEIGTLTSNPKALVDYMVENTSGIYNAAPQVSQAMQINVMNALQFLKAKMPAAKSEMPLSPKFEPTPQERGKFSQYYAAVNDPISVLKQVKNGSLSNESMEALQQVHQKLLTYMRQVMYDHWEKADVLHLPYGQKLSIAKFLNVPLDENMTTLGITANQMAISAPQQSQQIPAGMQKTSQKGLDKLNASKRSETRANRPDE
jgi:hypothetical protein